MSGSIHIAFVGQPNTGKSTLFNAMTGSRQHVANYPGITVEKKTGEYSFDHTLVHITDLPGTYSLTSYSPEETVTRNFIVQEKLALAVNIADASNLERHLYLTFQLLEMHVPVLLYLNKMDTLEASGQTIDVAELTRQLGIPILTGVARKQAHTDALKQEIHRFSEQGASVSMQRERFLLHYDDALEAVITHISEQLQKDRPESNARLLRWISLKVCEKDRAVLSFFKKTFPHIDSLLTYVEEAENEYIKNKGYGFEMAIALARSGAAREMAMRVVAKKVVSKKTMQKMHQKEILVASIFALVLCVVTAGIMDSLLALIPWFAPLTRVRLAVSLVCSVFFTGGAFTIYRAGRDSAVHGADRIDRVLCHRVYGLIILVELVLVFYWITVVLGYKMTDKVFPLFKFMRAVVSQLVPMSNFFPGDALRGLVLNGIIDGAIMILNYIPIFFCLFALVSFLEDVGYMARLAFIMDRILRKFGLHGQSTLPMMLSGVIMGGCAVPGVMSTRTIRDTKSRLVTILILPLLNCMAKIPFYVLITGIFFVQYQWLVLGMMSFATIIVALFVAKYLSLYVVPGEAEPFVLELPAYTLPTLRGVLTRTIDRLWGFIKKVATTVAGVSAVIWFGVSYPQVSSEVMQDYQNQLNQTISTFAEKLHNDYAPYFAHEKGFLQYDTIRERFEIISSLNILNSSSVEGQNTLRLFIAHPEITKVVLKGRLDLGSSAPAFTQYLEQYTRAKYDFDRAYGEYPDFEKPLIKKAFYSYWQSVNPIFFAIVRTGTIVMDGTVAVDTDALFVSRQMRSVQNEIKLLLTQYKRKQLEHSFLGLFGKALEPVTQYAGFNWKINIALLGSFAAKEALVSTLGTIYSVDATSSDSGKMLKERIHDQETGMTALDGLVIMLLISLFPPCIATMMATKTETQSIGWTAFSILYPVILGSLVAALVFQLGGLLGF